MTVYQVVHSVSRVFFNLGTLFTLRKTYGKENIPAGGAVICPNHAHNSDPFYLIYSFSPKDKIWIMAKEEVRHFPVVGAILNKLDFLIFVKRGAADVGAVKTALRALKGGEKLLIFPEGTRNEEIGEGKTGAAMLAIRTGLPVLPVYISAERKLFHRTKVIIGTPYHPFTETRRATAEDYKIATEGIMERIRALGETAGDF